MCRHQSGTYYAMLWSLFRRPKTEVHINNSESTERREQVCEFRHSVRLLKTQGKNKHSALTETKTCIMTPFDEFCCICVSASTLCAFMYEKIQGLQYNICSVLLQHFNAACIQALASNILSSSYDVILYRVVVVVVGGSQAAAESETSCFSSVPLGCLLWTTTATSLSLSADRDWRSPALPNHYQRHKIPHQKPNSVGSQTRKTKAKPAGLNKNWASQPSRTVGMIC